MSTAAPSGAGQAAPAQAPTADAAPVTAPAGEPAAPRPIKPIPPPPRLPGVLEDGPEDARTRTPDSRARDAQGRFLAGEPSDPKVVAKPKPTALEAADGIPAPPVPEPTPAAEPFEVAGEKYESREKFEQTYKSLKGMFKPLAGLARDVGGMDKIPAKFVEAAQSANGWYGEAQRLAARIAELEATPQPQPTTETAPAPDTPGIDWDLFAEISKVANEAGTPWKAQQWLQEQVDAQRAADIKALREEAIENPRREAARQAELAQTADTIVESMAAHTNPDGSPAFPEYRDGEQAHAVGSLWASLGFDPELALTPHGAVAAVAIYRMAKGLGATPRPAVPTPATAQPPVPNHAAEAAASLDGGRALLPNAGSTRALAPEAARIVSGLKNTQLIRPGLGFEA